YIAEEEELLIDPALFPALKERFPRISHSQVLLKRGSHQNELTKFRYDVILKIEESETEAEIEQFDWQRQGLSLQAIGRILATEPVAVAVRRVPNSRLMEDVESM